MDPQPSRPTSEIDRTVSRSYGERFTHRLEAFSDLVFGFSLSLLATRLDVPNELSDVFNSTRWGTFMITFAIICAIWLAHYRIFRHQFVAKTVDVIINFVFLLGIAIMPYAVQTVLRFMPGQEAIMLYFGDFALILGALATLRWRALLQRRGDPDVAGRVKEWRETVRQYAIVLIIVASLVGMRAQLVPREKFYTLLPAAFVIVIFITRLTVRQLPKILQ